VKAPLRILLLSDGRPGHYHLAEGLCAALRRLRPVDVTTTVIKRRLPTRVLVAGMRTGILTPAMALRLGYGFAAKSVPPADLVISAGGDTIAANVAAARLLGAPNIFCGTLRHAAPEEFSLIVSSYARHEHLARHIVCLKPTAMDPDALGRPKDIPAFGPSRPPSVAALLIGGDSGLFRYTIDEWRALLAFVSAQHAAHGTRWLISTSRRTPEWVADAVAQAQGAGVGTGAIEELLDYRKAGPGTLPRLLARADVVLCTEDSSTMISETIAARLPVVGIAPRQHSFKSEEADYRALMIARGWARFAPLAEMTPDRLLTELAQVKPLSENHLVSLSKTLAERLPELVEPPDGPFGGPISGG
jgi:uncharacterized protein